jgi:hypothetical protein
LIFSGYTILPAKDQIPTAKKIRIKVAFRINKKLFYSQSPDKRKNTAKNQNKEKFREL